MPGKVPTFQPRKSRTQKRTEQCDPFYTGEAWRATRLAVLVRDEYTCQYCGRFLYGLDATVDHVIERQDGGSDYDMTNLKAACRTCNSRKGARRQRDRGEGSGL